VAAGVVVGSAAGGSVGSAAAGSVVGAAGGGGGGGVVAGGGAAAAEVEGSKMESTLGTVTPTVLQAYVAYANASDASVESHEAAIQ